MKESKPLLSIQDHKTYRQGTNRINKKQEEIYPLPWFRSPDFKASKESQQPRLKRSHQSKGYFHNLKPGEKCIHVLVLLILLLTVALIVSIICAPDEFEQEITNLRELCPTSVHQAMGYTTIGSGKKFFYWMFGAKTNPSIAPIIFYLSSTNTYTLHSLINPASPCEIIQTGNKNSRPNLTWNEHANIVYVDFPLGEGFSMPFQPQMRGEKPSPSKDLYLFIDTWLSQHFVFRNAMVYIYSEGSNLKYTLQAGQYLIASNLQFNFKGFILAPLPQAQEPFSASTSNLQVHTNSKPNAANNIEYSSNNDNLEFSNDNYTNTTLYESNSNNISPSSKSFLLKIANLVIAKFRQENSKVPIQINSYLVTKKTIIRPEPSIDYYEIGQLIGTFLDQRIQVLVFTNQNETLLQWCQSIPWTHQVEFINTTSTSTTVTASMTSSVGSGNSSNSRPTLLYHTKSLYMTPINSFNVVNQSAVPFVLDILHRFMR